MTRIAKTKTSRTKPRTNAVRTQRNRIIAVLKMPLFWASLSALVGALALNNLASAYTLRNGLLTHIPDALFEVLPFIPYAWPYDVLSLILVGLLVWQLAKDSPEDAPVLLFAMAGMHYIRAFCIFVNPIAPPHNSPDGLFEEIASSPDMVQGSIPSGHTMSGVFIAMYLRGPARIVAWCLVVAMMSLMLLARGHYTIDLVMGLIIGYAAYMFCEHTLRRINALRGAGKRDCANTTGAFKSKRRLSRS